MNNDLRADITIVDVKAKLQDVIENMLNPFVVKHGIKNMSIHIDINNGINVLGEKIYSNPKVEMNIEIKI